MIFSRRQQMIIAVNDSQKANTTSRINVFGVIVVAGYVIWTAKKKNGMWSPDVLNQTICGDRTPSICLETRVSPIKLATPMVHPSGHDKNDILWPVSVRYAKADMVFQPSTLKQTRPTILTVQEEYFKFEIS